MHPPSDLSIATFNFDADLYVPPDKVPNNPPVETRAQVLPFGQLSWENFERLCLRLASVSERAEFVVRYGRHGQKQEGIDIFVRAPNGKYDVWQAKRYADVTAGEIKKFIKAFVDGQWKSKAERLYLAIQAPIDDKKIQSEGLSALLNSSMQRKRTLILELISSPLRFRSSGLITASGPVQKWQIDSSPFVLRPTPASLSLPDPMHPKAIRSTLPETRREGIGRARKQDSARVPGRDDSKQLPR